MGFFDSLQSFADGTLIEDTLKRFDEGLANVENLIGESDQKLQSAVDVAEGTLQRVVDGADRASQVADTVVDKVKQ